MRQDWQPQKKKVYHQEKENERDRQSSRPFEELGLIEPLLGDLGVGITDVNAWELDEQAAETADMVAEIGLGQ